MKNEEVLQLIAEAAEAKATVLDLSDKGLTELPPEIGVLTNLIRLDLSWNRLTELPPEIGELTNLTSLDLWSNQFSELPPEIGELTNLTSLSLGSNQLLELPPEIVRLSRLSSLNLYNNQLIKLLPEIGELTNLTALYLGTNRLTKLPPQLAQLTNLTALYLWGNRLTELPPELFRLGRLTELDLSCNRLRKIQPEVARLTRLTKLNLSCNRLAELPPQLAELPSLADLDLDGNPLIFPPLEVAGQGVQAVRQYLASPEGTSQLLAEIKVVVLGDESVGKTSLIRCLMGEQLNPNERPDHGISISSWQPEMTEPQIQVNFWDFGVAEIMHATHQFFLSPRSLCILVLDGQGDERLEHWLRQIRRFAGGSPVLIVLNKQDINPGFDLNRPLLTQKYPFIHGFHRTACTDRHSIALLRAAIIKELRQAKSAETRWIKSWFWVKDELKHLRDPFISYEQFAGICINAGVTEETSREALTDFLHDLGAVIRFKDFELEDLHVLDPEWMTAGLHKIVNALPAAEGKGILPLNRLKAILRKQNHEEYFYPRGRYSYLIALMKKFELCYELEGERILIPQLLEATTPSFAFDEQNALQFVLQYHDFLPPAVLFRFLVKRQREIKDGLRWRSGMVLENVLLASQAVVRADIEAKRIHIAVSGAQPKAYLTVILFSLRKINASFASLKVSERIPMPDNPACTAAYKTLLHYAEQGLEKYIPEGSDKAYSVRDLLNTVDERLPMMQPDNASEQ